MKPRIAIPVPTSHDLAYNHQNWGVYAEAVRACGGEPVKVRLDLTSEALRRLAEECAGYVLPGSPADVTPERYGQQCEEFTAKSDEARERTDLELLASANRDDKPLLAICFGMQMMNVWRSGTLLQDLAPVPVNHAAGRAVATAHFAVLVEDSRIGSLARAEETCWRDGRLELPVNSSHHQAVGIAGIGLRVTARSVEDGVVEAVESEAGRGWLLGVQWHPERTFGTSVTSQAIFAELVRQAEAHTQSVLVADAVLETRARVAR